MNKLPGKIVEVEWLDATDDNEIKLKDIRKKKAKDYLIKRRSIGKLLINDETGVVILKDMDKNEYCEITAIPKKWVMKIDICHNTKRRKK